MEINVECPKEISKQVADFISKNMEEACALFFDKLPVPAEVEIADHWVH